MSQTDNVSLRQALEGFTSLATAREMVVKLRINLNPPAG